MFYNRYQVGDSALHFVPYVYVGDSALHFVPYVYVRKLKQRRNFVLPFTIFYAVCVDQPYGGR